MTLTAMLRLVGGFALALASQIGSGVSARAAPARATVSQGTILDGVTIVDTRSGALKPRSAILIEGGMIRRIAPAGSMRAMGAARLVRANGKFVVPGYLDMHAHPLNSTGPDISLPVMVAYGVTGYRQMAGSPELLAARRADRLPTSEVAPELLALTGQVLAGPLAGNPDAAVAAVRKQKAEGANFIKVVDLAPPDFFATLDAARSLGLPVAGHLPPSVDVREAAARGMTAIEHLGPNASMLEACSRDEAAIRRTIADAPAPRGGNAAFSLPPAALKRLLTNPQLLVDPAGFRLLERVIETYDDAKCRTLARTLAASGMWQVPTLIRLKAMEFGDDRGFSGDPELRYVPATDRQVWQDVGRDFATKLSPSSRATLAKLFPLQLRLVKLLDGAGVPMLAGTDFGGQWIVPGASLHQEFDLLSQAGLSPLRILQMTTLNGARFLGREARMGTVEVGKTADLVLLDANPVMSVKALHRINAVVRAGVYFSRSALDDIKRRAAERAAVQ